MSTSLFAIFALIPPPIPGMNGTEKQIGPTFTNEAEALHALSLSKAPNGAKLEVRPLAQQSAAEKQAQETAKVIEKETAKAARSVKSSFDRDITKLAKAVLESGIAIESHPMLLGLREDIRMAVVAKIAVLSLPENRAKVARESAPKSRFKPLSLPGLAMAIGVESLDEIAPFPKRPDSPDGLPQYVADMRAFERALSRAKPHVTGDHGQDALNRAALRRAIARVNSEIEIANHFAMPRRVESVVSDVSYQGKRYVERQPGVIDKVLMPDWPLNTGKPEESVTEAKAKAPAKPEAIDLDIPAGMDLEALEAARKGAEKRVKINSVIRNELGPGFQPKPVIKTKDYSGGQLSWGMKPKNFVATFSKG